MQGLVEFPWKEQWKGNEVQQMLSMVEFYIVCIVRCTGRGFITKIIKDGRNNKEAQTKSKSD
jgi:hypothetical protein